jgi:hypothetical protein
MASYPGPKVHRVNRRKLGRGQYPSSNAITVTVTDAGAVATLTFSRPVTVNGTIPLNVSGGLTFVSQAIVSPTVVTQTWSAALTGKTYSIPTATSQVTSYQGGALIGAAGTFP